MSDFNKDLQLGEHLLALGFSLMYLGRTKRGKLDKKAPAESSWGQLQETAKTVEQFRRSPREYTGIGLICGYNDVECIDVDSKVIADADERQNFLTGLFMKFEEAVEDFYDKVVIVETTSGGYHILYQAYNIQGNLKLASLEGHKEAVLETRGIGGYVAMYTNVLYDKGYLDISMITEQERDLLISICREYNHETQVNQKVPNKTRDYFKPADGRLTPWAEYNSKHTVFELILDEMDIVQEHDTYTEVLRHGSEASRSGVVYKDSGGMWLFSTGTRYPSNTFLSPFLIYTHKNHGGDTSKAAAELYKKGYGERFYTNDTIVDDYASMKFDKKKVEFPLDVFPSNIYDYVKDFSQSSSVNLEALACSVLYAVSSVIGNAIWYTDGAYSTPVSMWMVIVAPTSTSKTPSYQPAINPLKRISGEYRREYDRLMTAYREWQGLNKKAKEAMDEPRRPMKRHFFYEEGTFEGFAKRMEENPKSLCIFMDEFRSFVGSLDKYNRGSSEKSQYLSGWSGGSWSMERKDETASVYAPRVFANIYGTIQPEVMSGLMKQDTQDGFFQRILYCVPDIKAQKYEKPTGDMTRMNIMYDYLKSIEMKIDNDYTTKDKYGDIVPQYATLSSEAYPVFKEFFDGCSHLINKDDEDMAGMLGKMQSYVCRLAVMLNVMYSVTTEEDDFLLHQDGKKEMLEISQTAMQGAVKLSEYFIYMARKMKFWHDQSLSMEDFVKECQTSKMKPAEIIPLVIKNYPDVKGKDLASVLKVTPATVSKYKK